MILELVTGANYVGAFCIIFEPDPLKRGLGANFCREVAGNRKLKYRLLFLARPLLSLSRGPLGFGHQGSELLGSGPGPGSKIQNSESPVDR